MAISNAAGRLLASLTLAAAFAGGAVAQPAPQSTHQSAHQAAHQAAAPRWPGCSAPPDHSSQDPMVPFGCATEANLRAIIADPGDLEHGATPTPEQGDAAFAAAARHRLGEVKSLASDSTAQKPLLVEGKIDTGK